MFGLYFGEYLKEHHLITEAVYDEAIRHPYALFVQMLIENNHMSSEELDRTILAFQKDSGLTDEELDALKSDDIDRIIPIFIRFDASEAVERNLLDYQNYYNLTGDAIEEIKKTGETERFIPDYVETDPANYNRFVGLALRTLFRFTANRTLIKKVRRVSEYAFHCLASQQLKGSYNVFMGFSGRDNNLLVIADAYGVGKYAELDEDALGCVCELINCISGLYASEMSNEDAFLEICLPNTYMDGKLTSNGPVFCLPLVIDGVEIDMIVSVDTDIEIL